MEAAAQDRSKFVRIADRAARLYAPAVHTLSALTFAGWMIADSPALNALDHPRYDVWVLRCITS